MNIDEIVNNSKASIEKNDLRILLQLTLPLKPKCILEIGTWRGYSARIFYNAFNEIISLLSIEKEKGILEDKIDDMIVTYYEGYDSHDIETLQLVKRYVEGFKFDFLFIDGDHSYEGVKKDWEMYSPLVKKGGVVVFHDVRYVSLDPNAPVEVKYFWDELKYKYPYVEIKSSERSTGMGVIYL